MTYRHSLASPMDGYQMERSVRFSSFFVAFVMSTDSVFDIGS